MRFWAGGEAMTGNGDWRKVRSMTLADEGLIPAELKRTSGKMSAIIVPGHLSLVRLPAGLVTR